MGKRVTGDIDRLRMALRRFAAARDWDQFHSPKNLASALSVEAAELLERFQWLTAEESKMLSATERKYVQQELADVFLYLIRLADKLDINIITAAEAKLRLNGKKYPVAQARGNRRKYTEL